MAGLIYLLCALTAFLSSCLLFRAYAAGKYKLLLWSGICFAGLALNNVALFADMVIFPLIDFSTYRLLIALCAMIALLYGLIWDTE